MDYWKFKMRLFQFFIACLLLTNCSDEEEETTVVAQATLSRISNVTDSTYTIGPDIAGKAMVETIDNGVRLTISVEGLTPNSRHAVHLHLGSCEAPGAHWNQSSEDSFCEATSLGVTWAKPKAGDVGNVNTDGQGNGSLTVETDLWSVGTSDEKDILGAVVIIHQKGEEFLDHCFGNHDHVHDANAKIACGTIEP